MPGGVLNFRRRLRSVQARPTRRGFPAGCRRGRSRRIRSIIGAVEQTAHQQPRRRLQPDPLNSTLARFAISATAFASNSLRESGIDDHACPERKAVCLPVKRFIDPVGYVRRIGGGGELNRLGRVKLALALMSLRRWTPGARPMDRASTSASMLLPVPERPPMAIASGDAVAGIPTPSRNRAERRRPRASTWRIGPRRMPPPSP